MHGCDSNLLAVTAAKLRVALLVSHLTGSDYKNLVKEISSLFRVGDSLENYTEQDNVLTNKARASHYPESWSLNDIVIANPPYVRANRIQKSTKEYLKRTYPSVAGGSVDLYNYFIAHGILSIKPNGILCYVSPATFQKSKYGKNTRKFLVEQGALQVLLHLMNYQYSMERVYIPPSMP